MNSAIVLAAGMGKRMNTSISKQFLELKGKPVLYYPINQFNLHTKIDEIVIVIRKEDEILLKDIVLPLIKAQKPIKVVLGGSERVDSVRNGLNSLNSKCKNVLIHDGVRPFISSEIIEENIRTSNEHGACITAVPSKDTIKIVDEDSNIIETPIRSRTYMAQTPQSFRKEIILRAFEENKRESKDITDDSMLVENLGISVKVVKGDYRNIKITTPEDIGIANQILKEG